MKIYILNQKLSFLSGARSLYKFDRSLISSITSCAEQNILIILRVLRKI